jgi:hypothetical protein
MASAEWLLTCWQSDCQPASSMLSQVPVTAFVVGSAGAVSQRSAPSTKAPSPNSEESTGAAVEAGGGVVDELIDVAADAVVVDADD